MELLIGGTAAAAAGAICNPLEVVKIRMQLQGELQARGHYAVHYRNVFHAAYTIATKDGIFALQKGVIPFVWYQFAANSMRLGSYHMMVNNGWTKSPDGTVSTPKTMLCCMCTASLAGLTCSPFYLVKTHLQSKANEVSIAVGHQHQHTGMYQALTSIAKEQGFIGLWRGTTSNIPRLIAASWGQLLSFEKAHEYFKMKLPGKTWTPLCVASFVAGFFMAFAMAPFDLIATRFYNQGTNAQGKGLYYKNVFDCMGKVYKKEGILAFFKGWTACYFRLGPYTMLVLVFWERLKHYHQLRLQSQQQQLIEELQ